MGFFSYLKDKLFGWKKKSKEEKLAQKQAELEKRWEDELLRSQRLEKYQAGLSKSSSLGSKLLESFKQIQKNRWRIFRWIRRNINNEWYKRQIGLCNYYSH